MRSTDVGDVTFSFGENWLNYSDGITENDILAASSDIDKWLGKDTIPGKTVLDIGSGSGIHSLAFLKLGAASVHSFDYDKNSVQATTKLRKDTGDPVEWTVEHGSILNDEYIENLGTFDIVYSWGVLHHTGSMWDAVGSAYSLVAPGGKLWISLYQYGPRFQKDLKLKQQYNNASALGKRLMEARRIARIMLARAFRLKNPFTWNKRVSRGMSVYYDIVDWLGGLPYETASEDQVVTHARKSGFVLDRISIRPEGACSIYVFTHVPE